MIRDFAWGRTPRHTTTKIDSRMHTTSNAASTGCVLLAPVIWRRTSFSLRRQNRIALQSLLQCNERGLPALTRCATHEKQSILFVQRWSYAIFRELIEPRRLDDDPSSASGETRECGVQAGRTAWAIIQYVWMCAFQNVTRFMPGYVYTARQGPPAVITTPFASQLIPGHMAITKLHYGAIRATARPHDQGTM